MEVRINDTIAHVPTDLSQIPLGKFVQYWNEHGRDLDKRLQDVHATKYDDDFERELDFLDIELDEAVAWYSFFTGFNFNDIKDQQANELLIHYRIIRDLLKISEEEQYKLDTEITWNNEVWKVKHWKVTSGAFILNELLTSKEITRQINSIGKGRWEALPYLCAVFFRKVDEPFTEELVKLEGDRMKLMQDLPMSYAMQVAFFLSASVSTFKEISVFLNHPETAIQGWPDTSNAGHGLIS